MVIAVEYWWRSCEVERFENQIGSAANARTACLGGVDSCREGQITEPQD